MSNSEAFKNVHEFDGHWEHNVTTRFTLQEKVIFFNWLISYAKTVDENHLTRIDMISATNGLKLVIENSQKTPNFDPVNKIFADDILAEICKILVDSDDIELRNHVVKNVLEQMSDMYKLGRCSQGKSTRLIQLYKTLV